MSVNCQTSVSTSMLQHFDDGVASSTKSCEICNFIADTGLFLACVRHFDKLNIRISINFFLPFATGFVLLFRLLLSMCFYIFRSRGHRVQSLTPDILMSRFAPVACNHIVGQTLIKNHLTPTVFICYCSFFLFCF